MFGRVVHQPERISSLPPHGAGVQLDVRDLGGHMTVFADGDQLAERVEDLVALVADVADIKSTVPPRHLRQRLQFARRRIEAGVVLQARGQPQASVVHLLGHQRLHLRRLIGRRGSLVILAHDLLPHGSMPNETGDVQGDVPAFKLGEIVLQRKVRAAILADHGRRDALPDHRLGVRVLQQSAVRV